MRGRARWRWATILGLSLWLPGGGHAAGCVSYVADPLGDTQDANAVMHADDRLDLAGVALVGNEGGGALRIRLASLDAPSDPLVAAYQINATLEWSLGLITVVAQHHSDGKWEVRGIDWHTEEDRTLVLQDGAPDGEIWIALPDRWLRDATYQVNLWTEMLMGVGPAGVTLWPAGGFPGSPRTLMRQSDRLPDVEGGTAALPLKYC